MSPLAITACTLTTALGAVGARSTVATRRMFANGVPRCIGSLVTAKPRSARRACHAASVRPV